MPWTDWQFWVVTLAALWGARIIVRQIIPSKKDESACASCAVGAAAMAKPPANAEPVSELPVIKAQR